MTKQKKRFILASVSPRRAKLLKDAGYRFTVIPSQTKESYPPKLRPGEIVKLLALRKAREVSRRYPDDIILGADTIVFLNHRVIGKPKNKKHAVRILRSLSGVWQRVYTGVAVVWRGGRKSKTKFAVSAVKMKVLTEKEINRALLHHLDKAGAYAIQEKKDPFVDQIKGDYDNVVGLPLRVVKQLFRSVDGE